MKKNNTIVNVFIFVVAILYTGLMVLGNLQIADVSIAAIEGSYADTYARENKLEQFAISDSEQEYFDVRYENFDYNVVDEGIVIEGYQGCSLSLVIPESIDGIKVTVIGEKFFETAPDVKEIYISSNVTVLEAAKPQNVEIYCSENSKFYKTYCESGWNLKLLYDSEVINYSLGDIPFEYNETSDSIEITKYCQNKDGDRKPNGMVVIPSYIDGKPVTTLSMDMAETYDLVVIPETVTSIMGITKSYSYSQIFLVETVFTVMAFLLAFIAINIILPRYNQALEFFLSGSQMLFTILYVILQTIFGIVTIYGILKISTYTALIISVILLLGYLASILGANKGRTHSKKITEQIEKKTEWMKEFKNSVSDMAEDIKDADAKRMVERLIEEISYSDPTSDSSVEIANKNMKNAVNELRKAIAEGETLVIIEKCKIAQKAVQKRNSICKSSK